MPLAHNARFDVATALGRGQRELQEDAIVTDFPVGLDVGYVVLADGMGGHAAGEIASAIIVTEVFAELKFKQADLAKHERNIPAILKHAMHTANSCIRDYVAENPTNYGMGATLVAPVFVDDRLYWISVGDSPLYLFRDGALKQLNEDHSMAPEIDLMVASGLITEEEGRNHPDRNCLRSVLLGDRIAKVDCPESSFKLRDGDIIVTSSDGLQFLSDDDIVRLLTSSADQSSTEIAHTLLAAVNSLNDPDQDNISISVVKVNRREAAVAEIPRFTHRRVGGAVPQTRLISFPSDA